MRRPRRVPTDRSRPRSSPAPTPRPAHRRRCRPQTRGRLQPEASLPLAFAVPARPPRTPAAPGRYARPTVTDLGSLPPDDRMMVEGLYWWGVPTLFRCPVDPDPAACDIALVGVPHSSGNGSTERDQHLGPRAVRNVSALTSADARGLRLLALGGVRIHDLGDVPLPEAMDNEACIERIEPLLLAARRRPARGRLRSAATIRSPGPSCRGSPARARALTDGRPVALVHLDAHTDSYESMPHWLGAQRSRPRTGPPTSSARAASTPRAAPRSASAATLARSTGSTPSRDLGYDVIEIERYRELGAGGAASRASASASATRRSTSRSTSTASTRRSPRPSRTSRRASPASPSTRRTACCAGCAAWTSSAPTSSA